MKNRIIETIQEIKSDYLKEGFELIGLFGSQADGSSHSGSDVDLLYQLQPIFMQKYPGFLAFERLDQIKKELETKFGKPVDLCAKSSLNDIGKKYILEGLISA